VTGATPDELHIICCDEDTGLCGAEVTGDVVHPDSGIPVCRRCLYLRAELVPCTHPQCGAR